VLRPHWVFFLFFLFTVSLSLFISPLFAQLCVLPLLHPLPLPLLLSSFSWIVAPVFSPSLYASFDSGCWLVLISRLGAISPSSSSFSSSSSSSLVSSPLWFPPCQSICESVSVSFQSVLAPFWRPLFVNLESISGQFRCHFGSISRQFRVDYLFRLVSVGFQGNSRAVSGQFQFNFSLISV